jgi:CheY-like chemotaxis protein
MRHLIAWLSRQEQLASDLYREEATLFDGEKDFSAFLRRLSEDEAAHRKLLESLSTGPACPEKLPPAGIKLNEAMKRRLEAPIRKARELAAAGRLSERRAVALIVEAEFSEWNDVFLYVINVLKERTRAAGVLAATIQAHEDRVKAFVDALPARLKPAKNIHRLPPVWDARVLVVEDDENLREALEAFLRKRIKVETARDGREALDKAKSKFFDLILADVRMPVMDGFELYEQLIAVAPEMKQRFLFWSGALPAERRAYLAERGLLCLQKPLDIAVLIEQIMQTVRRLSQDM